jgi:hypothetical protein
MLRGSGIGRGVIEGALSMIDIVGILVLLLCIWILLDLRRMRGELR